MKYFTLLFLLLASTNGSLLAHVFEINFDSSPPYPVNIIGCTTGDANNYFGDLDETNINHNFTNDNGDFLAVQNTMGMSCASNSCIKSLNYSHLITNVGVSGLKVCFDVAVGGTSGWDTDAKLMVTLEADGSAPRYIQFSGGNSDGDQPGLDAFCDGTADGYENGGASPTYPLNNTFQTFCFELGEPGFVSDIDVNVHFIGFDRPGENVAVDNIITYFDFNTNGGAETDFPNIPLTPYCILDCPLLTDICDVYCDANTSGNDNYSVEMAYVGGDQGAGTYNISGTFSGPHPNSNYYDLLVFSESETNNLNINISDASNCSIQENVLAPSCMVSTCTPSLAGTNPPLVIILAESNCQADNVTLSGGSFAASTFLCPANSTLEYSIDGGNSWSTNLPVYDQYNQMSVKTRCICDIDPSNISNVATINTSPGSCPTCTAINVSAQATCSSNINSNQFYVTVNALSGGDATSAGSIYTFDDGTNQYTVDGANLPMDIGPFNYTGGGNINFTIYDNDDLTCTTTLSVAQFNCTAVSILNIKAFLAGPYTSGGIMTTTLSDNGEIPAQHPYSVAPYNAPAFATNNLPANMVDYVLIEARTTLDTTSVVIQEVGILLDDGTITATNGGSIQMNLNAASSYYIWVRHRNHLDIVTPSPMTPSNNMNMDFTNSMNSAYGAQQLEITSDGRYALHTGDFDRNGVINNGDIDQWKLGPAILGGYNYTDSNLDATVQVTDFDRWYYNRSLIGTAQLNL